MWRGIMDPRVSQWRLTHKSASVKRKSNTELPLKCSLSNQYSKDLFSWCYFLPIVVETNISSRPCSLKNATAAIPVCRLIPSLELQLNIEWSAAYSSLFVISLWIDFFFLKADNGPVRWPSSGHTRNHEDVGVPAATIWPNKLISVLPAAESLPPRAATFGSESNAVLTRLHTPVTCRLADNSADYRLHSSL